MTNAEAWFNIVLRPRKPEGSLGRTAQDGHLDSHTAPELCKLPVAIFPFCSALIESMKIVARVPVSPDSPACVAAFILIVSDCVDADDTVPNIESPSWLVFGD